MCPLQAAPARALEWELPLEELRALVADVASGKSKSKAGSSPGTIVSHGLEWWLVVEVTPNVTGWLASRRPVQLGLFLVNSFRFVPEPLAACELVGLSYRIEAARPGARLQPLRMEEEQWDKASPNSISGLRAFLTVASGSVDDPALAPFVHTALGSRAKVLRLRGEVLGLE